MNVTRSIILESGTALKSTQLQAGEELWERIALLNRGDQLLLELSLRGGASHRQIGRVLNRPAWSVTRSLRRIARRLHDPLVAALLRPHCPLEPEYRQLGVEHFLIGLSVAELAEKHAMSPARVRRVTQLLRDWHRGVLAARRSSIY